MILCWKLRKFQWECGAREANWKTVEAKIHGSFSVGGCFPHLGSTWEAGEQGPKQSGISGIFTMPTSWRIIEAWLKLPIYPALKILTKLLKLCRARGAKELISNPLIAKWYFLFCFVFLISETQTCQTPQKKLEGMGMSGTCSE